jgi:hypothetical protein
MSDPNTTGLLLLDPHGSAGDDLTLTISSSAPFDRSALDRAHELRRVIDATFRTSKTIQRWKAAGDTTTREAFETWELLDGAVRSVDEAVLQLCHGGPIPLAYIEALQPLVVGLDGLCRRMCRQLMALTRNANLKYLLLDGLGFPKGVYLQDNVLGGCKHCEGDVALTSYRIAMEPGATRHQFECMRCRCIEDAAPEQEAPVFSDLPDFLMIGQRHRLRVSIKNTTRTPAIVHLLIDWYRRAEIGGLSLKPFLTEGLVQPGESLSLPIDLESDSRLPAHLYHLRAFASVNGHLSLAIRNVVFDRTSRTP